MNKGALTLVPGSGDPRAVLDDQSHPEFPILFRDDNGVWGSGFVFERGARWIRMRTSSGIVELLGEWPGYPWWFLPPEGV